MTRDDCAVLSIHGCPKCLAFLNKEPNESCWDWGKRNPDKVKEYVAQMLSEMGADGKRAAYCTTCRTLTVIDQSRVFDDDYVGGPVILCSKCGEMLPVAEREFVL